MCAEHPFHSLYQVYCLQPPPTPHTRHSGRLSTSPSDLSDRSLAAKQIFDKLRSEQRTKKTLQDVEALCLACVEWADHPIKGKAQYKSGAGKDYSVPAGLLLLKISNLKVPVITGRTPVEPSMQYQHCTTIVGYDKRFQIVGGINVPKIINCQGSDGLGYKQLVRPVPSFIPHPNGAVHSSKAKVQTICVKMQLWNRCLISSIVFSVTIERLEDEISASETTK